MYTLEQKINIALTYIATDDESLRAKLKSAAIEALNNFAFSSDSAKSTDHTMDIDDLIAKHLKRCGMPPHVVGYGYMVTAIKLCMDNPEYLRYITKRLYVEIASRHNSTPSRVERALRHAVELCFDRADTDDLIAVFGYTIDCNRGKLTNGEFVAASVNEISQQMKHLGISKV